VATKFCILGSVLIGRTLGGFVAVFFRKMHCPALIAALLLVCITASVHAFSRRTSLLSAGSTGQLNFLPSSQQLYHVKTPTTLFVAGPSALAASSLVGADDMWTLWAVASTAAAMGLQLEKRTAVGKALSGPVCAMLCTAILTNVGVLPATGSIHLTQLQVFVVKLATPLLLLGADLNKIVRQTGVLLRAFLLGTIGTLVGSTLGFALFAPSLRVIGLEGDSWKIAAALTAKNIGGGLNFMSVCGALQVNPVTIGTGLAVDNLLGLLYFPFISWLGRNHYGDGSGTKAGTDDNTPIKAADERDGNEKVELLTLALSVSMILVAISEFLSNKFAIPSVPIVTLLTVILATAIPSKLQELVPSGDILGKLLLLLFFGSIGNSSGTIMSTITGKGTAGLVGYGLTLYLTHLAIILGVGKVARIPLPDLLVASNANIGNAATASALASAKGWQSRLLPALLVGTLGNAIGTFAGLSLGVWVLKALA